MKKRTIRVLSLLLTLVMFMSLATPAFALGNGDIGTGWDRDIDEDEIRDFDEIVPDEEFEEEYDYFQALDETNGTQVTVEAPMGSLPTLAEVRLEPIPAEDLQEAVNALVEGNPQILVAMDISFWLDDIEIEPEEPVRVKISAPELEGRTNLQVIHFPDDVDEPETIELIGEEDLSFALGTNEVAFMANSFSVYAIVGGITDIPDQAYRATYEFYNSDGSRYEFQDASGVLQYTQILKNGEELVDVGIPTVGSSANAKFVGWYEWIDDGNGQGHYGNKVEVDEAKTVTANTTIKLRAKMQGIVNVYFVTAVMKDATTGAPMNRSIVTVQQVEYTAGQTDPITIDVSGITTDAPTTDQAVIGWNRDEGAANGVEDDPATTADEYVPGVAEGTNGVITLYPNGNGEITDVMMFPAITRAAWVFFHENDGGTGGGASYTPPVFVQIGGKATKPTDPHRTGYTFGGWYLDENCTQAFDFNTAIYTTTHLYAKWTGSATTYSIVVWVQRTEDSARLTSASNLPNDGDGKKTYNFYRAYSVNATTGGTATVPNNHASRSLASEIDEHGHIRLNRVDANTTVAGNGSTVLNVYYDRDVMTIYWRNSQYGSNTDTWYGLYDATFEESGKEWKSGNWRSPGYTIVMMDSFKDFDQESDTELILYPNTASQTRDVYFYKETLTSGQYTQSFHGDTGSPFKIAEKYTGFRAYQYRTSTTGNWTTIPAGTTNLPSVTFSSVLQVRYQRNTYRIEYHNGAKNTEGTTVRTDSIKFEAPLSDHTNPTVTYPVAADADHYQFIGWFADSSWSTMVTFTELTEQQKQNYTDWYGIGTFVTISQMPAHDLALYAGYALKGWDCALNPNGGTFTNSNQAGVFWLDYGQMFSSDLKQNITREGYSFQGWMVAQVPYKADGENLDLLDITLDANNHRFVGDYSNWTMTDEPWEFSTPISGATALMAKWFYLDTMTVVYDAGAGSNAPTDNGAYSDHAQTVAFRSPTPPANQFFKGWDIQGTEEVEKLKPGTVFEVNSDYAVDGVVTLVAVYGSAINDDDPVPVTHIDWYANNKETATYQTGVDENDQPITAVLPVFASDIGMQMNDPIDIRTIASAQTLASEQAVDNAIFTNGGYTFLGWAKLHKDESGNMIDHNGNAVRATTEAQDGTVANDMDYLLTEDNLYLKYDNGKFYVLFKAEGASEATWTETSQVAADESKPYDDMYAVWELKNFYVYHSADNTIEKLGMTGANWDKTTNTYNLTALTKTDYLYGGYYSDYAGKGVFTLSEINEFPYTDKDGTPYAGEAEAWSYTNAYTEVDGLHLSPVSGTLYYLKEVPAATYLRPYFHYTYKMDSGNEADGEIKNGWLFSDVDDLNYKETGFILITNNKKAEVVSSVTIQAKNSDTTVKLTPKRVFGVANSGKLTYWVARENSANSESFGNDVTVRQYWITPDGLLVNGTVERTYSGVSRVSELTAEANDIPSTPILYTAPTTGGEG